MSKYTEYMCDRADYAAWLGSVSSHISQEAFDVMNTSLHSKNITKSESDCLMRLNRMLYDVTTRLREMQTTVRRDMFKAMDLHDERAEKRKADQKDKREKLKDMYDCFSDILPGCLNKTVMDKS